MATRSTNNTGINVFRKKVRKNIVIIGAILFVFADVAYSHGGRTNSSGCHNNRKTGGYHCHGGGGWGAPTPNKAKKLSTCGSIKIPPSGLKSLQIQLNELGCGEISADGICGPHTKEAILRCQESGELK